MASQFKDFSDDVNGVIVGDVLLKGQLQYQGRNQGQCFYADTAIQLVEEARKIKTQLVSDQHPVEKLIYPNDSDWKLIIR